MSSNGDLTLTVRMAGDNKDLVGAVQASKAEIESLGTSTKKTSSIAADLSGALATQSSQLAKSSEEASKLMDRYDPLSAKLQRLKQDFNALSSAASHGHVAPVDDTRLDSVYAKIKGEIAATKSEMAGVGVVAGEAFGKMASEAKKGAFSTAQARRELIVMGHEAMTGNFSRMPGSFMVLGERISASGISLMGIAAPIITVAGAAFMLEKAFSDGEAEMNAMNQAMVSTGDYAGATRGEMRDLAASMSDYSTMTIGQSKAVVTQLVASGRIGGDALRTITSLTADFAAVTGDSVGKVGPQLVKLFEDPAKGAQQLNQSMHFLTASELEHIQSLQRMGETEQAQIDLATQLKAKINGEAESLGNLGGIWDSVKKSASEAWDAMMAMGRPDTLSEKISQAKDRLASAYKWHMPWNSVSDAQSSLQTLEEMKAKQDALAKQRADAAAANERSNASAHYMQGTDAYKIRALMQQKTAFDSGAVVDGTSYTQQMKDQADANFQKQIADLQNKSQGSDRARASLVKAEQTASYNARHEALLRQEEDLDRNLKNQLISYHDYYAKKRLLEEKDAQLKINGIRSDITAAHKEVMSATSPDQKYQAQARLVALQGELNKATEDYARIAPKAGQEATQAFKKLDDQVQAAKSNLLALQGKTADSEIVKLHQKYDDTIAQLKQNGDTKGVAIMNELFRVDVADARLKEIQSRFNETLAQMTDQERRISIDQQAGLATSFEARSQLKDLHNQYMPQLHSIVAPVDSMQLSGHQLQQADQMKIKIDQVQASVSQLNRSFEYGASNALGDYLDKISNASLQSGQLVTDSFTGMDNALTNLVTHGKFNINSLVDTIVTDLLRIQIEKNIMQPMASMMNSSSSSIFSSLGSFLGFSSPGTGIPNQPSVGTLSGFGPTAPMFSSLGASVLHSGGMASIDGAPSRYVHPAYFDNAPRFHTGIGPGEMAAIIQTSESVLTAGQMRQLAPVSALNAQNAAPTINVNIIGAPSQPSVTQTQTSSGSQIDVMFEQVDNYIASGIKTGNGATSMAIAQTYGADRSAGAVR